MTILIYTMSLFLHAWPGDFAINYTYISGTVPPPYHYEYTVHIDSDGNGSISYVPDYVFDTAWKETFKLDKKSMKRIWRFLKKNDFFNIKWTKADNHSVGGSLQYLDVYADNKSYTIPAFPTEKKNAEKFLAAVKELIPQSAMNTFSIKRDKYIEDFKKEEKE